MAHRPSAVIAAASLVLLSFLASPVMAQQVEQSGSKQVYHNISITMSPAHLALPFVDLMAEIHIYDDFSVAANVGAGEIDDVFVSQFGPQLNYYFIGSFDHGLHVGAEALGMYGSTTEDDIESSATAFSPGAFVGYKSINQWGLTFLTQIGYRYITISGESSNAFGASATAEDSDHLLLLRLNVGWSF